jgi:hypothetical protein
LGHGCAQEECDNIHSRDVDHGGFISGMSLQRGTTYFLGKGSDHIGKHTGWKDIPPTGRKRAQLVRPSMQMQKWVNVHPESGEGAQ